MFCVWTDQNDRYGHLTWEWKKGIRSYLHPMLFALLYKILALLHLDTPLVMVNKVICICLYIVLVIVTECMEVLPYFDVFILVLRTFR